MDACKTIALEWIPNAYSEKENILPKKEVTAAIQGDHLIVRATGLYRTKKIANRPARLRKETL